MPETETPAVYPSDELCALVSRLAAAFSCEAEHAQHRPWVAHLDEAWTLVANVGLEPAAVTEALMLCDGPAVALLFWPQGSVRGSARDVRDGTLALRVAVENAEAALALASSGADEIEAATAPAPRDFHAEAADTEPPPPPSNTEKRPPWEV